MTKDTVGRESVQFLEMLQPLCANTFGSGLCNAIGSNDTKCYNTRATCQDVENYRIKPEGGLGDATITAEQLGILDYTIINKTNAFFLLLDVIFDAASVGCLWVSGSAAIGSFASITGTTLTFSVRDGTTPSAGQTTTVTYDIAALAYKEKTICFGWNRTTSVASIWIFDKTDRSVILAGTSTNATVPFTLQWMDSNDGAIGKIENTAPAACNTTAFTGVISEARLFSNTQPPDMSMADFNLHLFFSHGKVGEQTVSGADYIIPSLQKISTAPSKINMNTANPDARGLGNRAIINIAWLDHQHTDKLVDPYLSGRSWTPMDKDRGTFWTRWLVRNKYHLGVILKIYEGYAGEALSAMKVRQYFMSEITATTSAKQITAKGKDVIARIEERKAHCPVQSPGVLKTDLNLTDAMFSIAGAILSEYPSNGILRIDDEIITYTAITLVGNCLEVTGVTRGQYNTVAAEHDFDAAVQECALFSEQTVYSALVTLLTTYGGLNHNWLDKVNWLQEITDYIGLYTVQALITEPTPVETLMNELQVQCLFHIWWCERSSLVKLATVSGLGTADGTFTMESHIIADSYQRREHERQRLSRVWIHFDQNNYVENALSVKAYNTSFVRASLAEETDELYGSPGIKIIYSRWLRSEPLVRNTAKRILTRQIDPPETISFRVDAKDRNIWTGDKVYIDHISDIDQYGVRVKRIWTITSAEELVTGEIIQFEAENTTAYGVTNFIMANSAANFPGYATAPVKNCYIGNTAGLLSDGSEAGTIT